MQLFLITGFFFFFNVPPCMLIPACTWTRNPGRLEGKIPLAIFPTGAKPTILWKSHDFQPSVPAKKVWRSCSKHPDVWLTLWTEKSLEVCLFWIQRIKPYYLSILINSLKCTVPTRQSINCVACADKLIGLQACLAWANQPIQFRDLVQNLLLGRLRSSLHGRGDL